jgi:GT2 family glycosyltransferase
MKPRVAIVIVTYNGEAYLPALFESLRAQTPIESTAIVVVDNASSDRTLAILAEEKPRTPNLHVLPQPGNSGFAGGNNTGLAYARSLGVPYAFLLNQDTLVTPGWLDPLLEVMEGRPDVAAAQPLLVLGEDPGRVNSAGNAIHFCGFGYITGYRRHVEEVIGDGAVRPVPYATGAALLLRLAALDQVGDFDEKLFLYHEDLELQLRLRHAGWECVLVPTSRVVHKYNATFSPAKYGFMERNRWIVLLQSWPASLLWGALPVLVAVEVAVLVFAARAGWLRKKLRGYREVVMQFRRIWETRRRNLAARSADASDVEHFTGEMEFEGLDHPIITRIANPVLATYWRLLKRVVRPLRKSPRASSARQSRAETTTPASGDVKWNGRRY